MSGGNLERAVNFGAGYRKITLEISSQSSDDSNLSLSDNASHGTNTPQPLQYMSVPVPYNSSPDSSFNTTVTKAQNTTSIYKPKYHAILRHNGAVKPSFNNDLPNVNKLRHQHIEPIDDTDRIIEAIDLRLNKLRNHQDIERIIEDNQTIVEAIDLSSHKVRHREHSPGEQVSQKPEFSRKRSYNDRVMIELESEQTYNCNVVSPPQRSPGPFLGNTRLVEVKQPRLDLMFDRNAQNVEIGREYKATPTELGIDVNSSSPMLYKYSHQSNTVSTALNLSNIASDPLSPSLTPTVPCTNSLNQSANILDAEPMKPYVLDMPEPKSAWELPASLDMSLAEGNATSVRYLKQLANLHPLSIVNEISDPNNFSHSSSLPSEPRTLAQGHHNGVTSTPQTLSLTGPELPRSEKPYGQLYINGHVYTYLGLACSTELFYCTYNRPQPMYAKHYTGFSMYSNWKKSKDKLISLEFGRADSRNRPAGYTLAYSPSEDILTHSSQRSNSPVSSEKKLENCDHDESKFNQIGDQLEQPQQLPVEQSMQQSTSDLHEKTLNLHITECTIKKQPEPNISREMIISETKMKSESLPNVFISEASREEESFQPPINNIKNYLSMTEDTPVVCEICNKVFKEASKLRTHMPIHYVGRPFRCESCGISFRTKGLLIKHERSAVHQNTTTMNSTSGAATITDPRPFKCADCGLAFRKHGILAKHFRSKTHIMKLECLQKLPFETYAELEKAGANLNEIDTTDCDTSLASLRIMAEKLHSKDPSKLEPCKSK